MSAEIRSRLLNLTDRIDQHAAKIRDLATLAAADGQPDIRNEFAIELARLREILAGVEDGLKRLKPDGDSNV
jgi:hypothetical protein